MRLALLLPLALLACSAEAPQGAQDAGPDGSWTELPDVADAGPPADATAPTPTTEWRTSICDVSRPGLVYAREVTSCAPLPPVTSTRPGWCDATQLERGIISNDECLRLAVDFLLAQNRHPFGARPGRWIEQCPGMPPPCIMGCDRIVHHHDHWFAAVQMASRTGTCWPTAW